MIASPKMSRERTKAFAKFPVKALHQNGCLMRMRTVGEECRRSRSSYAYGLTALGATRAENWQADATHRSCSIFRPSHHERQSSFACESHASGPSFQGFGTCLQPSSFRHLEKNFHVNISSYIGERRQRRHCDHYWADKTSIRHGDANRDHDYRASLPSTDTPDLSK